MPSPEIKWRVPIQWTVVQSDGWQIRFDVSQDGNTLVGKAYGAPGGVPDTMTGVLDGSVDGDQFYMTIYWPDNSIGKYLGTVSRQGNVEGTKLDEGNSSSVAQWFGEPGLTKWE